MKKRNIVYLPVNFNAVLGKGKSKKTYIGYKTMKIHFLLVEDGLDVGVLYTAGGSIGTLLDDDYDSDFLMNYEVK